MNNKLLAVLAVAVFLASGSVAVAAAPSDAEGEIPLGTVFVDAGGEASVLLKFNETTYQGYSGYEFTLTAGKEGSVSTLFYGKGGVDDANETYNDDGNSFVLDDGSEESDKVTVSAEGQNGVYTVKFKVGSTVDVGQYDVLIDLHVVASPVVDTKVELLDITYKAVLKVTQNSNVTISYAENKTIYAGEVIKVPLTVKYSGENSPEVSDEILKNTRWYATNLPEGLIIEYRTDKLYLIGLTNDIVSSKAVQVVGRDINGNEMFGTLTLTIAKMPDIYYNIKPVDGDVLSHDEDTDTWVVKTNSDNVILTIKDKVGSYKVSVIKTEDTSMSRAPVDGTKDSNNFMQYSIPINGAGYYAIEIDYGGGTKVVNLHIVPNLVGAGAGFEVVGGA